MSYFYILSEQDKTHIKINRRGWDTISLQTSSNVATCNQEKAHNPQIASEEWRVWTPHVVPQLLRLCPERWDLKTSSFESYWAWFYQIQKALLNCERVPQRHTMANPPGPSSEAADRNACLSVFSLRKVYLHTLKAAAWESSSPSACI